MLYHFLNALTQLLYANFFELASGYVFDLVEKYFCWVHFCRMAWKRYRKHSFVHQELFHASLQFCIWIMNQIALDYQIGRTRVYCRLFSGSFRSSLVFFYLIDPSLQEINIALVSIKTFVDMVKLNPIQSCHYADMQNILLVQNMVKFSIIFAFHPHAASTLV